MFSLRQQPSRRIPPMRFTPEIVSYEFDRRRRHLAKYRKDYDRVIGILFETILARTTDLKTGIIRFRYQPRPRIVTVAVGWEKEDGYPRTSGAFMLWRDHILHPVGDVEVYPRVKLLCEEPRRISDMSDDNIVETILTCVGAPWVDRFAVPPEAGALRHDARRAVKSIELLREVVPNRYQKEVEELLKRARSFAQAVGA